jgi:GT2 family glycosyltransferase
MTVAISVSTYMSKETYKKRIDIFKDSMSSLLSCSFDGNIYVVDDCSFTEDHINWLEEKKDNRVKIIRHDTNKGISGVKNTGIKNCFSDETVEYCFLLDDDMIYIDKEWYFPYVEMSKNTGLQHFSYAADVRNSGRDVIYKRNKLRSYKNLNGCMLFISREMVKNIGYFKIFPYKYGYEHCNYTYRHNRFYENNFTYDLCNSDKLLELHTESVADSGKSIKVNVREVQENGRYIQND